jgi:hypothetical protein
MTYTKKIYDVTTGEETIVPMTEKEIAENKAEVSKQEKLFADRLAMETAKATEKAALLAKLGITEDEARLLLS